MLINWLFRLLIPYWDDLVCNPLTGKASQKSMFSAVGFMVGIGLAVLSVLADIRAGRPVEKTAIMLLLANGLGLAALKIWSQQANRETATPEGQPLAVPQVLEQAPEIMPQVPNPNGPAAALGLALLLLATACVPSQLHRIPSRRSEPVDAPARPVLHRNDRRAIRHDRGLDRASNPALWYRLYLSQRADSLVNH